MRISVIIPTHKQDFLQKALDSVYAQTFQDWEIVLVPHGDAVGCEKDVTLDSRVRVLPLPFVSNGVGHSKNWAFSQGLGDILLELDHDDILLPTALEEVDKAFQDPEVGFVYSNFAEFNEDKTSRPPYDSVYGWQTRPFEYEGRNLHEMVAFRPSPQSVSLIWYAPNHLRAWRRDTYAEVGGHDVTLSICDDQDLICRSYLKTKFAHIDKCLYLYRVHGNNTWLKYNSEIQGKNWEVYAKYIESLSLRWSQQEGLKAIDICGGFYKPEGFLSVDLERGDITANLDEAWPFEDGSVGVIRAQDALEHLKDKQHTMSEVHRVLAPGGVLLSKTPSANGNGAFMDPTHVSYWVHPSFWYYTRKEQAQFIRNTDKRFMEMRLGTIFPTDWHRDNNIPYVIADLMKLDNSLTGIPGQVMI